MSEREEERVVCSNCGGATTVASGSYAFKESGLSNVTLDGVDLITCSGCGNVDPVIPDVNDLMQALAWHLCTQPYRLKGEDVRFLRKYLGMTGVQFSRLIGVDNTTLSKWETGDDPIGPANDRLIRSLTLTLGHGLKERAKQGIESFTWIDQNYYLGLISVDMETLEVQNT
jgi:DNA-binding transcriptional regulator YiaG